MQINWYRTSLILWTLARPGQGGRVIIGLVEGPCKISNSQEVTSSGDFFDIVGNNYCSQERQGVVRRCCQALLCPGVSSPSVREGVQGQAGPGATEEILIIAGEGRHEGHQQGGDGVDEAPDSDVGHGEKLASTGCWNPVLRININGEVRAAGRLSGTGATRS